MRPVLLRVLHHGRSVRRRVRLLHPSSNWHANCGAYRHAKPSSDVIANHHAPDFQPDTYRTSDSESNAHTHRLSDKHLASNSQPNAHAHRLSDILGRPDSIASSDHCAERRTNTEPDDFACAYERSTNTEPDDFVCAYDITTANPQRGVRRLDMDRTRGRDRHRRR